MAHPRLSISQMREAVTVYTAADAPFGTHSLKRTYTEVARLRARIVNISGSSFRHGIALDANITHTVEIRDCSRVFDITTEHVLQWKEIYMRIRQVRPVGRVPKDPRNQFILLMCEAEGNTDCFKDPSPETE